MASSGDTFAIAPGSAEGQHDLSVRARIQDDIAETRLGDATSAFKKATFDVLTVPGCFESLDQARSWANKAEEGQDGKAAIAALAMAPIRDELMEDRP